jgi:curli production assembly/transport component CsgE
VHRAIALAVALLALPAAASEDIDTGALDERSLNGLEQGGLVVDRTITHFGAEFVRQFSAHWRQLPEVAETSVTITERPSARWGSIVFVEVDRRPIARVFLYAGRSATIRPLAEAAAQYVARQIADERLASALLHDPDLARDELQ